GGGINVIAVAQGSSELNISLVVRAADAAAAQRRIHDAFQLAKIGGGRAVRPEHVDVVLFGVGTIGRTLAALLAGNRRAAAIVRVVGCIDRSGFLFASGGLSPRRLAAVVAWKNAGKRLADAGGGERGDPARAVAEIARHALSTPILVDLT